MIVRVMGEGQWRVDDGVLARLNELDDEAVAALERNDEETLDAVLERMAETVRREGEPLPADDLHPSEIVIPPVDLTLDETRELFSEHGLVPELPA